MKTLKIILLLLLSSSLLFAQSKPYRYGTTTASFLEIGFGSAGAAMGDAYVTMAEDISAIYWNPAGLAFMEQSEAQFVIQPWLVDISSSFAAAGVVLPGVGTVAFGLTYMDYGDIPVTTVEYQEGTGEIYSASDFAFTLSYARKLTDWFGFGASGKYIGSSVWHMDANAIALDLGVSLYTNFFSPTGERRDGMRIAMSIANYGTRMQYDGMDLFQSIDIRPREDGNYEDVLGKFSLNEWELPLIFRLGFAVNTFKTENSRLSLAFDALHPNNNAESVNVGGEYELYMPSVGKFFLRAGYKGLFLPQERSEYGLAFGGGFQKYLVNRLALKLDYAFRDYGILGNVHSYSIGFLF